MKSRIVQPSLGLGVACLIAPAIGQTPAQGVTAAMQGVEVGEGRVAQCLKGHAAELSPGCDQALTDVGVQ
jgi:hypothetical protein